VLGLVRVTRAFLPAMRERRRGRIVNVSSVAGRVTLPFFGPYNSTKHAVESISDSLRHELRPHGVEVVVIEPGAVKTRFGSWSSSRSNTGSRRHRPTRHSCAP
jgi:short-subunit dehydrogenase